MIKKIVKTLFTAVLVSVAVLSVACVVDPPHVHSYGEWSQSKDPTCTESGEEKRVCDCGEFETRSVVALGHSWGHWLYTETEHYKVCTRDCGTESERGEHAINKQNKCDVCDYSINFTENLVYAEVYDDENTLIGYSITGFEDGTTATELVIPTYHNGLPVVEIGDSAFELNTDIVRVQLPETLKVLQEDAFSDCTSLTAVNLPEGITELGNWCLYNTGITQVIIPDSVITLGKGVLQSNANLAEATVGSGVQGSAADLFRACKSLKKVTVRSGSVNLYNSFNYVDEGSVELIISDIITELTCEYGNAAIASVHIGSGITKIPDYLFGGYSNVTELEIPEGVTELGMAAFSGWTALTSVSLPKSLKVIKTAAFLGANSLTSVVYGGTVENWLAIERPNANGNSSPFKNGNTDFTANGEKITELYVDSEVIPKCAFSGHKFTKITLGEHVRNVEDGAISTSAPATVLVLLTKTVDFDASLPVFSEVYFAGTVEEMRQGVIAGGSNTPFFQNGAVHYFLSETGSDEEPEKEYNWQFGGYWHYVDGEIAKW